MPAKPWIPKYIKQLLDIVPLLSARGQFLRIKQDGSGVDVDTISQDDVSGLTSADSPTFSGLNVTGDVNVQGVVNSVSSQNLKVQDTTITLNNGATGNGLSTATAGIIVDRGTQPSTSLVFNESNDTWTIDSNAILTTASTTGNLPDSTDKRYVTDAQRTVLQNTSGINTGDQNLTGLVPKTTTVNGYALNGNITLAQADIAGLKTSDNPTFASGVILTSTTNALVGYQAPINSANSYSTSIGTQALAQAAGRSNNTAVGYQALYNCGSSNGTAVGAGALTQNSGDQNTAVGTWALTNNLAGARNTAVGAAALQQVQGSNWNTAIGNQALYGLTGGNGGNTALGTFAGNAITTGQDNIFLGFNAGSTGIGQKVDANYSIAIGYNAVTTASNQIVIGSTPYTNSVVMYGTLSTVTSDTSGVTDILVNPTTKTSGNLIDTQINGTSYFKVTYQGTAVAPSFNATSSTGMLANKFIAYSANTGITIGPNGTQTQGGGSNYAVQITPTYNQTTSSAANTDLIINRTETSIGSGSQNFLDLQVAGVSKTRIDNSGMVLAPYYTCNSGSGETIILPWATGPLTGTGDNNGINIRTGAGGANSNQRTNGNQVFVKIAPSYNQTSSTASNVDLLINRTETSVGSGAQYLIQAQVGGISRFKVDNLGTLTLGTSTALSTSYFTMSGVTHVAGLYDVDINNTFSPTGSAQQITPLSLRPIYNQPSATSVKNTDLLINRTETNLGTTPGAQLLIDAQVGGSSKFKVDNTGILTVPASVYATGVNSYSGASALTISGSYNATQTGDCVVVNTYTAKTNTSGQFNSLAIKPTYNQGTGATATNTDLLINRTETSIGTGTTQRLIDAQVGSVSKFYVTNTGYVNVNNINPVGGGTVTLNDNSMSSAVSNGLIRIGNGTWTNTSGSSAVVNIVPTYNQSGGTSVANTDLLINRTETSLGTTPGNQYFIDAQVGGSSKFRVVNDGSVYASYLYTSANIKTSAGSRLRLNSDLTFGTAGQIGVVALEGTTYTQTSGANTGFVISPTYNQTSGTAANTDLLINRTQTAVGSGAQNLIDAQVGGVSQFSVTNGGAVTAASGLKTSTVNSKVSTSSLILDNSGHSTAMNGVVMAMGTMTQASGSFGAVAITPTYNQSSSTAANTDLLINRTETTVGSGAQLLADFQVGGVSKANIDRTGKLTATAISLGGGTLLAPMLQAYMEYVSVNSNVNTTQSIDCTASNVCSCTLTGNTTFSVVNAPMTGMAWSGTIYLIQSGSGSYTVTWPASFSWGDAGAPVLSTAVGKKDIITFSTIDGGVTYQAFLAGTGF